MEPTKHYEKQTINQIKFTVKSSGKLQHRHTVRILYVVDAFVFARSHTPWNAGFTAIGKKIPRGSVEKGRERGSERKVRVKRRGKREKGPEELKSSCSELLLGELLYMLQAPPIG